MVGWVANGWREFGGEKSGKGVRRRESDREKAGKRQEKEKEKEKVKEKERKLREK